MIVEAFQARFADFLQVGKASALDPLLSEDVTSFREYKHVLAEV